MKSLVLVDIENICGSAIPSPQSVRLVKVLIDRVAKIIPDESFYVIGCHEGLRKTVTENWPKTNSKGEVNRGGYSLSGKDGADRSIVHWLHMNQAQKEEWERIILISGDHYFLEPLLQFAKPSTHLVQIARNNQSRHHDYLRFKRRFKTIFIDDIIKIPVSKWTYGDVDGAIDTWFDAKHQAHLRGLTKSPEKTKKKRLTTQKPVAGSKKAKNSTQVTKGLLAYKGKELSAKRWDQSYDWVFEATAIYLCSATYQKFREAEKEMEVFLTTKSGESISTTKK